MTLIQHFMKYDTSDNKKYDNKIKRNKHMTANGDTYQLLAIQANKEQNV